MKENILKEGRCKLLNQSGLKLAKSFRVKLTVISLLFILSQFWGSMKCEVPSQDP